MTKADKPKLLATPEHIAEALIEQGETTADVETLVPVVTQLSTWFAPVPNAAATTALVERLIPLIPARSSIRRALHAQQVGRWADVVVLLRVARLQASILRPSFWFSSVTITLLGVFIVTGSTLSEAVVLQLLGPLLSYIAVLSAFRATEVGMLECELACPPSARQLMLARLVVVLGYDVGLGILASVVLWAHGGSTLFDLALCWLAPLLLVFGVTLALSLYVPVQRAAALVYAGWVSIVVVLWLGRVGGASNAALYVGAEVAACTAGLLLIGGTFLLFPNRMARLLPHH